MKNYHDRFDIFMSYRAIKTAVKSQIIISDPMNEHLKSRKYVAHGSEITVGSASIMFR